MNRKKLLSLFLCFTMVLSCIVFVNSSPVAKGSPSLINQSKEPVCPPESDFTYRALPFDAPVKAVITGYSGSETKIIIPESIDGLPVTNIGYSAFSKNEKITYIKLPSTLAGISGNVFELCSSLTEIDIDPSHKIFASIDGVLYRKNTDKESPKYGEINSLVIFPAGKSGKHTIPYGVETIGSYAFSYCYNLTEVDMYNTVTTIQPFAFTHCWNLSKIRLSDNLHTLGTEALAYCESLTRIDLPANLNTIGKDAVLGNIDSDDNKIYYFTDGISCVKDSYAHKYLQDQWLPESIMVLNNPTITDNDTGIKIIDAYDNLPKDGLLDITVEEISVSELEIALPTRYSSALAFDIEITNGGQEISLDDNIILSFDSVCPGAIPSATKIYKQIGNTLTLVSGSAHTPFVGAQVSEGGRFIILMNDDFSLKGDVDGDGIISLFDVKIALHSSAGTLVLTEEQSEAANADNSSDGKITTDDARKILRIASGIEI